MATDKPKGFTITEGKGYQMTFANGWTVSVQWGPGNYCGNRRKAGPGGGGFYDCPTAEVAVWDGGGRWVRHPSYMKGDDVAGDLTPDEAASIINWARRKPKDEEVGA